MSRRFRRWTIWLLFLLALGAGAGFYVWYYERFQMEVLHGGKTQRQWAAQLYSSDPEERREAANALLTYFYKFGVSQWTVLALLHALKDDDAEVRTYAASALGIIARQFGPETAQASAAVPKLIPLLEDEDLGVCRAAARSLGTMGTEATAALPQLEVLFDKKDELTRLCAAESWCLISGKSGKTVAVLQLMVKTKEVRLREAVAETLGVIGWKAKEKSVTPLLMSMAEDSDDSVRQQAVRSLGKTGPAAKEAVPALIRILKEDGTSDVRRQAAAALSDIAPKEEAVVDALIQALHEDPDWGVRWGVAHTMEHLYKSDARVEEALIEALEKEKDGFVRSGIAGIFAYSKAPPPKAYQTLVKTLNDENWGARAKAAEAVGFMGNTEVIPKLIDLLHDESWFVRWHAILGLRQFGSKAQAAIPRLEELLNDPQVSDSAKWALKDIRGNW